MNRNIERLINRIEQEARNTQSFDISRAAKTYGFGGFNSLVKDARGCYLTSKGLFGSKKTPLRGFWYDFYDVDPDELQDFLEEILNIIRGGNDVSECDATPSFVGGHREDISKKYYEGSHDKEPVGECNIFESNDTSSAYDDVRDILQNTGDGSPESKFILLKNPLHTVDDYFGNVTVTGVGLDDDGEVLFISDGEDEFSLYEASETFCRKVLAAVQESQNLQEVTINGFEGDYDDDYVGSEEVDPSEADWQRSTSGYYDSLSELFKSHPELGILPGCEEDVNEVTRKAYCRDDCEGVFVIKSTSTTKEDLVDFFSREDVQAFLANEEGFEEDTLCFSVINNSPYYQYSGNVLVVSWDSASYQAHNQDTCITITDPDALDAALLQEGYRPKKASSLRMRYTDCLGPTIL